MKHLLPSRSNINTKSLKRSAGSPKRIMMAWICLVLVFLACTPITVISEDALQQTNVAESVQETLRIMGDQPTASAEAPLSTETPTVEPTTGEPPTPSSTPTPTPTESPWIEGSVERAPYDPAADWGAPDVHDDFSGTNPEFELDNSSGVAHGWYANGRYNITFPTRGWWTWYKGMTALTNFYADIVVYNGDQCVDRDAGGMLYRYFQAGDFGLLFGVTCGGGYFLGVTGGPGPSGVVCSYDASTVDCSGMWDHPTSEYIDVGPGAANRIGIKAIGQQITLYVNGHEVDSMIIPAAFVFSGNFALYLGAGQRDNASVSFDDMSIWFNP
ncbi:MAG: hypothetical protein PVI78_12480 [Anaerolineales bacterium]|jgi:hypothetical protein